MEGRCVVPRAASALAIYVGNSKALQANLILQQQQPQQVDTVLYLGPQGNLLTYDCYWYTLP